MGSIVFDSAVNSIFFGGTEVKKVYKGDTLIWQKQNSISVSSYTADRSSAAGSFPVIITSDMAWTASVTSGSNWIYSVSPSSGNAGQTSVTIKYYENTNFSTRSANIVFTAGNATCNMALSQSAATPYFDITTGTQTFDYTGGSVELSISSNIPRSSWYVVSKDSWLSCAPSSNNIVYVNSYTNVTTGRTGSITLGAKVNGITYSDSIMIKQTKHPDLSSLSVTYASGSTISGQKISTTYSGGTYQIKATATDAWGDANPFSIGWSAEISGLYIKKSTDSTWRQSGMSDIPSGTIIDIRVDSTDITSTKTATLTISSGSKSYVLTIEQGAASKYLNLNTTNINEFAYGGASKTFSVDTNSDVSWSITDNRDWITISKTSGTGAYGPITVTASSNTSTSTRSGTVTVTGGGITKTFTVSQAAKPFLTVSPLSVTTTSAAKYNGSLSVSSNTNWSVSTNKSYVTLTSGTSGSNNDDDYRFEVAANTSTSSRDATITFSATDCSNQVVSISQQGVPYSISISPTSANVGYTAGSGSFTVSSNGTWDIGHIAKGASATKSGNTVSYSYPEYDPDYADSGYVTYSIPVYCTADTTKTATFTIRQSAPTISVSSSTLTLGGASGSSASSITVTSSGNWTAISNQSWLSVTGSGSSGAKPTFTTNSANTGTGTRSATVTFKCGSATATVTVTQSVHYTLSISPTSLSWGCYETTGKSITVTTNASSWSYTFNSSNFTASKDGNKLTITPKAVNRNTTAITEQGTISAGGNTATFSLSQAGTTFEISPSSLTYTASGGSKTSTITVPSGYTWTGTASSDSSSWCTVLQNGDTLTVTTTAKSTTGARETLVTVNVIYGGNIVDTGTISVSQAGVSQSISVSPTSHQFNYGYVDSFSATITCSHDWSASIEYNGDRTGWLSLSQSSGSGNKTITVTHSALEDWGMDETATIMFTDNSTTNTASIFIEHTH